LSGDTLKAVLGRLGGTLIFEQEGSESAKVSAETTVEFLFAESGGEKRAWPSSMCSLEVGPVEFITAIDTQGQVRRVRS
jgi:hypothetical protein